MKILISGQYVNVNNEEVERIASKMKIPQEEALQIYLEDEGILHNKEQEALCKKAKDNRITATIHKAGNTKAERKHVERERKANPTKELIIAEVAKMLPSVGAECIKVENVGKIITFTMNNEEFKIDLVQKRKK